jgi:beta-1,4-mannooligosaccharide/beta-1,4-mannosyl-N-acetylglucosamine phosphorylase
MFPELHSHPAVKRWNNGAPVLSKEHVPYEAECIFNAGAALLDIDNPAKVIGLCREPLLAPETVWECDEGFRTNVIFPGALIAEDSGELKIYYGASDTVECLAVADIHEIAELCKPR